LTVAQETQIGETTKAFAFWADLRQWSSADRAFSNGWFGFHSGKCERSIQVRTARQVDAVFNQPVPFEWFPEGA
jgi:hypothetical protein